MTNEQIKKYSKEALTKQLVHDYYTLFDANKCMTKRFALRKLSRKWAMPVQVINEYINNHI